MGREVLVCLFLGFVVVSAAPKVGEASFDNLLQDGNTKISSTAESGRSNEGSLEDEIVEYIQNNSFDFSFVGSTVTLEGRNLDKNELDLKLNFGSDEEEEDEGRGIKIKIKKPKKHKLKKIFAPILVFILIKAMTLIPLALGILGIKTWNAIQLSFISFVSALAMAVWKLCSKINHEPPQIIHQAWDPHHHDRSDVSQQMAYSGYATQQ